VCLMVPVPDEADEDARRCVRERTEPISERVIGGTGKFKGIRGTLKATTSTDFKTGLGEAVAEGEYWMENQCSARRTPLLSSPPDP
jgi:hypothetical protein